MLLAQELADQTMAPTQPPTPVAPSPEEEQTAKALLDQVNAALLSLDVETAKATYATLTADYSNTQAAKQGKRIEAELAVIGKPAGELTVVQWYHGEATMNDGAATLLVFWEKWCSHCKREVPILEQTYQSYQGRGLNLVGLTKASRGVTDADINQFITEKGISYPIAKDDGTLSSRFAIRGIPAAVLIKDNQVIWRGHPARISADMLERALQ
jgi:thiol-disulfide isomerase/thioredoxin